MWNEPTVFSVPRLLLKKLNSQKIYIIMHTQERQGRIVYFSSLSLIKRNFKIRSKKWVARIRLDIKLNSEEAERKVKGRDRNNDAKSRRKRKVNKLQVQLTGEWTALN